MNKTDRLESSPSASLRAVRLTALCATLSALATLACSSGQEKPADGADSPESSPRYLIHSAVQSPEQGRTNYFTAVASLDEPNRIDYANSLELVGRARVYADPDLGYFVIGDAESHSLTRYELSDDGQFVPGTPLSLQQYGVTSLGAQAVLFLSPTKAYYKDDSQGQIIVWNPSDMSVEKVIPLPEDLVREGKVMSLSDWGYRDGQAYVAVGWSSEEYDRVDPGLALVRLDTESDALTVSAEDRCRGVYKVREHEGTLYFFSGVINGFGFAVHGDDGGQQDCVLRILPNATEFDPDYLGSIAPALGPNELGTGIAVTDDGRAWYQVVDTTLVPTAPGTSYGEWYATGWTWRHVDLATLAEVTPVTTEVGAYAGVAFVMGDDFFISDEAPDYSETTLLNLGGGSPTPGVSFAGFTLDVIELR